MSLPDPPFHLDPDLFAEMGAKFMNAWLLSVAVELGIFEKLADGPRGEPARHGKPSEQFARIFSEGVEAWTGPGARALPKQFDFGSRRRLLDVGGGTGTPLLIVDQWMDGTHTQPVFGAMLAATYLMLSGDGDTYSVDEARPWLKETGWSFVEHRPLAGVTSLVVSEAC
jgi:hypothetical protein